MPEADEKMEEAEAVERADTSSVEERAARERLSAFGPSAHIPNVALDLIPTLLPPHLAQIISSLSMTARVSMRAVAFIIECILETVRYGTHASLGITRRMLIAAVSSARRMYLISNSSSNDAVDAIMGQAAGQGADEKTDHFLQVLDKVTNLGVYIIYHSFTLAELFAMSGFYMSASGVKSARQAAEQSVNFFDSLFGSTETSRALASMITLVRKELVSDERFEAANKGKVSSLTALTKALTAFACLQNATQRRVASKHKLRVLYDCTVFGSGRGETGSRTPQVDAPTPSGPLLAAVAEAGPGPTTQTTRNRQADEEKTPSPRSKSISLPAADWERELEALVGDSEDEQDDDQSLMSSGRTKLKTVKDTVFEIFQQLEDSASVSQIMRQLSNKLAEADILLPDSDGSDISSDDEDRIRADALLEDYHARAAGLNGSNKTSRDEKKLHLVLRNITRRLRDRKRTVRKQAKGHHNNGHSRPNVGAINWKRNRSRSSTLSQSPPLKSLALQNEKSSAGSKVSVISAVGNALTSGHLFESLSRQVPKTRLFSARNSNSSLTGSTPPQRIDGSHDAVGEHFSREDAPEKSQSRSRGKARAPHPKRMKRSDSSSPLLVDGLRTPTRPSEGHTPSRHEFPNAPPSSPRSPTVLNSAKRQVASIKSNVSAAIGSPEILSGEETSENGRSDPAEAEAGPSANDSQPEDLFPHDHLIRNIHRFMRYSSAAYGQHFLRILGLGTADYNFSSTGKHHANSWAFAQHTNLPIDSLLLSSFTEPDSSFRYEKAPPLVHYIAVDHPVKSIVLTCRGTLGLQDVLVDLTCDYINIIVEDGEPDERYFAHSGMYHSAVQLTDRSSTVHQTLIDALTRYPDYGLVICGHSLGGGVAALLAILCSTPIAKFKRQMEGRPSLIHPEFTTPFVTSFTSGLPPGRPVHCYSYGPPAVASSDLARYARGLITSIVHGSDIVPTLSLGVLRDLRNVSVTLFEEGRVAEEIVGRVVGVYQRKFEFQRESAANTAIQSTPRPVSATSEEIHAGHTHNMAADKDYIDPALGVKPATEPDNEQVLSDWMLSLIKTMRADMDNEKLYPPGKVYIMEYYPVFVPGEESHTEKASKKDSTKLANRVILRQCDSVEERFGEPLFAKTMLNDHLPSHYERSSQLLFDALEQKKL